MEIITEKDFVQAKPSPKAAIVKFVNFSKTAFTWTWNKIPYTFLPGEENAKYMERSLAIHFATHLVNRELLARGRENDTSPRKPEENPYFMELFNRCVIEVDAEKGPTDQTKLTQDAIDRNMKAQMAKKNGTKPKTTASKAKTTKKGQKADETADKQPSPEELARMTGQSEHHPKLNNQPASKADEDFEIIETDDDDEDEA